MTNEKHFPKPISQWEFDYGLFTNLPRPVIRHDIFRVHSNSKEGSYLSWQNTYRNSKTTCDIKLKFFLWTKLPENLLLAKCLRSATAPLNKKSIHSLCFMFLITFLLTAFVFDFFHYLKQLKNTPLTLIQQMHKLVFLWLYLSFHQLLFYWQDQKI